MNVKVHGNDRLRLESGTKGVFADVDCHNKNGQYVLGVQFDCMHKLQMRMKKGTYKMFVIPDNWDVSDVDFGWWADAEVILDAKRK